MQVIDNFVKDPKLLNQLQNLSTDFWTTGWYWWQNGSPAIIYDSNNSLSTMEKKELQGDTYSLNHHFDKDEWLWKNKKILSKPSIGCVYYPPIGEQCQGGELIIYDTEQTDLGAPSTAIEPKHNRLVVFNPGQYHAVQEVTAGVRYAIAINVWENALSPGQLKDMNEVI